MSRSMSGPSPPSIQSSTYQEVRNLGREFAERRRGFLHRPRRERKLRVRQALLPSTTRPIYEAQDVSGSIDSFIAHSTSSYDSPSPYATTTSHSSYPGISAR